MGVLKMHPLDALEDAKSEQSLFRAVIRAAKWLDFDYCGYVIRAPLPINAPRSEAFNNYPPDWHVRYQLENYQAIDPILKQGGRSLSPMVWSDAFFAPARKLWIEARSFGLNVGWSQSCRSAHGVTGVLTLARSALPLTDMELSAKGQQMSWLAQATHQKMAGFLTPRLMPEAAAELSERELSILRFVAEGCTSATVAKRLKITERTVNFHVNNCCRKLNASNKTAATIRAAILGFL